MAKAKTGSKASTRKVLTAEEKEAKKLAQAAKYEAAVDKYVTINESGSAKDKTLITTQAMHIRGFGCMVRTVSTIGVSEVFVAGVKIKTKKNWKTLVEDKPKKDK